MTEKRFEDDFVERAFADIKAANKPTVNIESVRRVDGSEAVSIDAWLHRISNGYPEYAPAMEPPKQVGRAVDEANRAKRIEKAHRDKQRGEEARYAKQRGDEDHYFERLEEANAKQLAEVLKKEAEESPRGRWFLGSAKMTAAEFSMVKSAMAEILREKKFIEELQTRRDPCGQLSITGECARCGKTITSGIGSQSSNGAVLCGYCSDLDMSFEGQPTLRSRFPKDISPDTPGDGRIVRKSTYDKDLEARWWPHKKN
jgi:hypothetical protein